MSRLRKLIVLSVITLLVGIQGAYVVFKIPEAWPFTNYPMFSKGNPLTSSVNFSLEGVTTDGLPIALPTREYFQPFNTVKLRIGIGSRYRLQDSTARENALNNVLLYLAEVYEDNRTNRRHNGPPIRELRVIREAYDLTIRPIDNIEADRSTIFALDLENAHVR